MAWMGISHDGSRLILNSFFGKTVAKTIQTFVRVRPRKNVAFQRSETLLVMFSLESSGSPIFGAGTWNLAATGLCGQDAPFVVSMKISPGYRPLTNHSLHMHGRRCWNLAAKSSEECMLKPLEAFSTSQIMLAPSSEPVNMLCPFSAILCNRLHMLHPKRAPGMCHPFTAAVWCTTHAPFPQNNWACSALS